MGFFGKLFKGPQVDTEKSQANAQKMRILFNQAVEDGDEYRLIFGYTEECLDSTMGSFMAAKPKSAI